jgi:hypothetical protein
MLTQQGMFHFPTYVEIVRMWLLEVHFKKK